MCRSILYIVGMNEWRQIVKNGLAISEITPWWDMPTFCEPCSPAKISPEDAASLATPKEEKEEKDFFGRKKKKSKKLKPLFFWTRLASEEELRAEKWL